MQESILSESNNFDFIYSSFAIHHLKNEEKKSFLHQIFSKLKPGGTLVVIVILKTKNQTRENYLDEYIEHISLTWDQIENDDKELIFDHMRNFDFPTSLEMFKTWLQEIGFILVEQYEPDSRNSLLIVQKPS
ncbi:MAG: hypothetical protein BalsKO_15080 [Balneolaceae bacterium]